MKQSAVFTTTISPVLHVWLIKSAKKYKTTKRAIIESALLKYKKELRQKELAESFRKASRDPEIMAMAEEGMKDYNNQLLSMQL